MTNKKTIRDRGWNLANYCLPTDPDILKTRVFLSSNSTPLTSTPDSIVNYSSTSASVSGMTTISDVTTTTTATKISDITTSTIATDSLVGTIAATTGTITTTTTQVDPSPLIDLTNINFNKGVAGDFTIDIIQHFVRENNVAKNLHERYEQGRIVREGIDGSSRLTGGSMFNGNKIVLDEEILAIREGKEKEKSDAKAKVIQNAINKFKACRDKYITLIASNNEESKYTAKQKKMVIYFKKRKADKEVPSRADTITLRFNEIKDRLTMTV